MCVRIRPDERIRLEVSCSPSPGAVSEPVKVFAAIAGLTPASTYHYRVVIKTGTTALGADKAFETEAVPTTTTTETPPPPTTTTTTTTTGGGAVLSYSGAAKFAFLSSSTVSSSGAFTIKISCPGGTGACTGSLTLKTLKAVIASVGHEAKTKAAILTLAGGSFSLAAGGSKSLTLHLSSKGRELLAKAHLILAKATITAKNTAGESTSTVVTLTLKPAKKKK